MADALVAIELLSATLMPLHPNATTTPEEILPTNGCFEDVKPIVPAHR